MNKQNQDLRQLRTAQATVTKILSSEELSKDEKERYEKIDLILRGQINEIINELHNDWDFHG